MNSRIFPGVAIAVILLVNQHAESTANVCGSPKCVHEAAKVIDYVDSSVNPCDDFYQFACGNFLKNAFGNEKLELKRRTRELDQQEVLALYDEDLHDNDHKMVKVAKKLYSKCMDKSNIQRDFVHTSEILLKKLGGWPVLEGPSWNESNFDWLNATYELRRLGYDYTAFLNVQVLQDSYNREKRIFKIDGGVSSFVDDENLKHMIRIAKLLGAENEETASQELAVANQFLDEMNKLHKVYPEYTKHTIEEIQKSEGSVNWLEVINNLVGPEAQITKHDHILFPTKGYLKNVIELISKTSKRTQANYMMWQMLVPLLKFLPDCPASPGICGPAEDRTAFCMRETHIRLITNVPNPIDVIRLRRNLSAEKKKKIENLIFQVRSEVVKSLSKAEWIPEQMKHDLVDKLNKTAVVIGAPGDYFDDKMLDQADIDLGNVEDDDSFFTLLAKVTRNLLTATFIRANKLASENIYGYYILKDTFPNYYSEVNLLYVPVSSTKYFLYDENRPEYLNYGTLGTVVGSQLTKLLLSYLEENVNAEEAFSKTRECLSLGIKNNSISHFETQLRFPATVEMIIGEQVSYAAYEELIKHNGEESKLIATHYTPNQLFWISATSLRCQPIGTSKYDDNDFEISTIYSTIYSVSASLRHNHNFAKDFNCPINSNLNPPSKCKVL